MSNARIVYTPRPDATPESEATALATVYRFILDCYTKKTANQSFQSQMGKEVADEEISDVLLRK